VALPSNPSLPPSGSSFRVRAARRGDAASAVAILTESGAASDTHTFTWTISHPEMEVLIAADPLDRAIGLVTLSHRPILKLGGRAATIDELVVLKAWRRRGVGRELLRRAVERAKELSVKRLEVHTMGPLTDEVRAFFLACGFEQADVATFRLK